MYITKNKPLTSWNQESQHEQQSAAYDVFQALWVNGLIKQDVHVMCRSHAVKQLEAKAGGTTFQETLVNLLSASNGQGKTNGVAARDSSKW